MLRASAPALSAVARRLPELEGRYGAHLEQISSGDHGVARVLAKLGR